MFHLHSSGGACSQSLDLPMKEITHEPPTSRRYFVVYGGTLAGTAALRGYPANADNEKNVSAVEDLMREHGILRRALLVYVETALKIRKDAQTIYANGLNRAAKLLKAFGEDYHERKLEEAYIFPRVKRGGGEAALYVDVLIQQHNRGREVAEYITCLTSRGRIPPGDADRLAHALETFALIYQNHAAREDTIVFPAWKAELSDSDLRAIGDQFEDIENRQFGGDGFENAEKEIAAIENFSAWPISRSYATSAQAVMRRNWARVVACGKSEHGQSPAPCSQNE